MKKVLYSLLMLVALSPALACATIDCAPAFPVADELPCHQQAEQPATHDGPMLFKDCSNLDLHFHQSEKSAQDPVLKFLSYYIAFGAFNADYFAALLPAHKTRAPPDRQRYPAPTALYLSTLRIRV